MTLETYRTIFHVDMDAFYASVEQRDHPEYRGKPVIVGADPKEGRGRGVVAACSYQARRFGIHSALPISRAFRLCPQGTYLRPDLKKYGQVSREIRAIFRSFTDLVEPLSIDEAFLDMSHQVNNDASAIEVARSLKSKIVEEQRLASSIGIAPNKFVAKIASDLKKPDGLLLVSSGDVQSFLDPLPIARLWGVGPKTESKLSRMGIKTILQLRHYDKTVLTSRFGKLGEHLWNLSNGVDHRPVVTKREAKSIGHEKTFPEDAWDNETLEQTLKHLCNKVSERLCNRGLAGKTVTLKLRYSDFTTITRQTTLRDAVESGMDIYQTVHGLLRRFRDPKQKIRLVGVSLSSFESALDRTARQMKLF
ncbi:DNA polymerase IV [Acidobacteria bacterium AH-259-D05]|nr:DNA polymerase IV [Acidobacteria bacterium AH-259-D05]